MALYPAGCNADINVFYLKAQTEVMHGLLIGCVVDGSVAEARL
jgi:hypothetical protein